MARCALAVGFLLIFVVPVRLVTSSRRLLRDVDEYHTACEVFDPNVSGHPNSLYNPNFTGFQSLLHHVLNWGDTYLQPRWCGSGGFVATILAPTNAALTAGFMELNKRYGMHANPLEYKNAYAWVVGNDSPMVLGVDAIVEAGMIPGMSINLFTDKRIPTLYIDGRKPPCRSFKVHSSVANVNAKQVLHLWRNAEDGHVYVFLPGGLMPGPYRVVQKTVRHVSNCKTCFPVNDIHVYEVEGLLVPNTVALGLLRAPKPIQIRGLSPYLRKIGSHGNIQHDPFAPPTPPGK